MKCKIETCNREATRREMCGAHYKRYTGQSKTPMMDPIRDTSSKKHLKCDHPGCGEMQYCRGYCGTHYSRKYLRGSKMDAPKRRIYAEIDICEIDDCTRKPRSRGLCTFHNQRKRNGTPMKDPHRRPTPGEWGDWLIGSRGYVYRNKNQSGRRIQQFQHRFVMEQHLGRDLEPHETVHHLNGVRDDNRIENLELWSKSQPYGQRAVDKVKWAREILEKYEPIIHLLNY